MIPDETLVVEIEWEVVFGFIRMDDRNRLPHHFNQLTSKGERGIRTLGT